MRLAALDTATCIEDMDLPGFRLHRLKGDRKGLWAIDVSRNWRIVFSFEGGNAFAADYEDSRRRGLFGPRKSLDSG